MKSALSISDLATTYNWLPDSVGLMVLEAADGAGPYKKDGKISLGELNAALKSPSTPELMSTRSIETLLGKLERKDGDTRKESVAIKSFAAWTRGLTSAADASNGNGDGKISHTELKEYLEASRKQDGVELPVLTDQRLAVLKSQIAEAVGRGDYLAEKNGPESTRYRPFFRSHYRGVYDSDRKIPVWVSYTLSPADNKLRKDVKRVDAFRADTEFAIAGIASFPAWYLNTGYDMGHHMPYDDYSNGISARDSFLMSNMAPQTGELNSNAWRFMESGIKQLVDATGGTASVFTGSLFLKDDRKTPLAEEDIQYIGPDAANPEKPRRVAVPTHFYKAVLLTLPSGEQATFAWMAPNTKTVPTKKEEARKFFEECALSVAELEKLAGRQFFAGLSAAKAKTLKQNAQGLLPLTTLLTGGEAPILTAANIKGGAAFDEVPLLFPTSVSLPA